MLTGHKLNPDDDFHDDDHSDGDTEKVAIPKENWYKRSKSLREGSLKLEDLDLFEDNKEEPLLSGVEGGTELTVIPDKDAAIN